MAILKGPALLGVIVAACVTVVAFIIIFLLWRYCKKREKCHPRERDVESQLRPTTRASTFPPSNVTTTAATTAETTTTTPTTAPVTTTTRAQPTTTKATNQKEQNQIYYYRWQEEQQERQLRQQLQKQQEEKEEKQRPQQLQQQQQQQQQQLLQQQQQKQQLKQWHYLPRGINQNQTQNVEVRLSNIAIEDEIQPRRQRRRNNNNQRYRSRNESRSNAREPGKTLDLHGYFLAQGMDMVVDFLEMKENEYNESNFSRSDRHLYIITGRGKHSPDGRPVLRPKVEEYLIQNDYEYHFSNPGMIQVDLLNKRR